MYLFFSNVDQLKVKTSKSIERNTTLFLLGTYLPIKYLLFIFLKKFFGGIVALVPVFYILCTPFVSFLLLQGNSGHIDLGRETHLLKTKLLQLFANVFLHSELITLKTPYLQGLVSVILGLEI